MKRLATLAFLLSIVLAACSSADSDWQTASASNTIAAYQDFLKQYPNGTHADEARAKIRSLRDDQAWTQAQNTNTQASYQQYLHDEPNGAHGQDARDKLTDLARAAAWTSAAAANTEAGYQDFLKQYPAGPEADEAHAALAKLAGEYRVELGAYRSKRSAAREAKRLDARYASLLHEVTVVAPEASGKLNRVLSAAMTEKEARAACVELRHKHQHCAVVKV
ncbi:MAG TPA: SPOR domain-containing protein [Steroidobacteraceae bacterium]|nr:SPOR domain-containing protein [Steroidobacteraceae bacterium]